MQRGQRGGVWQGEALPRPGRRLGRAAVPAANAVPPRLNKPPLGYTMQAAISTRRQKY